MFTGIIQSVQRGELSNYVLKINRSFRQLEIGESIAINGVCLTLSNFNDKFMFFDVGLETLERTNLKSCKFFNIEKALKVGDSLSGHFVTGHIDGTVKLISINDLGNSKYMKFSMPKERWAIVKKGSIALNGISLTIAYVDCDTFTVQVIPHTYENTNLKYLRIKDEVNYEIDLFSRYLKGILENHSENLREEENYTWHL